MKHTITPTPGVIKLLKGNVSGLIALAESLERGKKLVEIEKLKDESKSK